MDKLASLLPTAEWEQTGAYTYFCKDPRLESIWKDVASELPSLLKGYGLQAWKTMGQTSPDEPLGYILPVRIISGEPRILNGLLLKPKSEPVQFKKGDIISGFLYYVVALPPSANQQKED